MIVDRCCFAQISSLLCVSLLRYATVPVIVSQDGTDAGVAAAVKDYGNKVSHIQVHCLLPCVFLSLFVSRISFCPALRFR